LERQSTDPPDSVWDKIGEVDVALLPADGSYHVLSAAQVDAVAERLKAKLIVPHHHGIWDVTTRGSTLLPPDEWVNGRKDSIWAESDSVRLTTDFVKQQSGRLFCFGEHVVFDKLIARGTGA
jgi:L-ascorbate metabolism protein UlaG (beta-lactamase superfamily)